MPERDWVEWHEPYDDPSSALSHRLETVQHHLAATLDRCPPGDIRVLSMCAGQGRDLFGVLETHHRVSDVVARLVELDPRNVAVASRRADGFDRARVEVVQGDAGISDAYEGVAPAMVLLVCGVFGNISDRHVEATVHALPTLCSGGATVIWTRHRGDPDLSPEVRRWFADAGFDEDAFEAPDGTSFSVGVHRLVRPPAPFRAGLRLFDFVGHDNLHPDGV